MKRNCNLTWESKEAGYFFSVGQTKIIFFTVRESRAINTGIVNKIFLSSNFAWSRYIFFIMQYNILVVVHIQDQAIKGRAYRKHRHHCLFIPRV